MRHFIQDFRYATRLFGRQPAFTVFAVLTVALGVGATTAEFTVFNAVLLRPLPYREPQRLVIIRAEAADGTFRAAGGRRNRGSAPGNAAVRRRPPGSRQWRPDEARWRSFDGACLGSERNGQPAADARQKTGTWAIRYAADPQLVGRFVEINNVSVAVVGILPEGFRLHFGSDTNIPSRVDVWFPTGLGNADRFTRRAIAFRYSLSAL